MLMKVHNIIPAKTATAVYDAFSKGGLSYLKI